MRPCAGAGGTEMTKTWRGVWPGIGVGVGTGQPRPIEPHVHSNLRATQPVIFRKFTLAAVRRGYRGTC